MKRLWKITGTSPTGNRAEIRVHADDCHEAQLIGEQRKLRVDSVVLQDDERGQNHQHVKCDGSWWLKDAQNIYVARVCAECEDAVKARYTPQTFTGYTQADVDEPIEPEGA